MIKRRYIDTVRCRKCGFVFHATKDGNDITSSEASHLKFHGYNPIDESLYYIE